MGRRRRLLDPQRPCPPLDARKRLRQRLACILVLLRTINDQGRSGVRSVRRIAGLSAVTSTFALAGLLPWLFSDRVDLAAGILLLAVCGLLTSIALASATMYALTSSPIRKINTGSKVPI